MDTRKFHSSHTITAARSLWKQQFALPQPPPFPRPPPTQPNRVPYQFYQLQTAYILTPLHPEPRASSASCSWHCRSTTYICTVEASIFLFLHFTLEASERTRYLLNLGLFVFLLSCTTLAFHPFHHFASPLFLYRSLFLSVYLQLSVCFSLTSHFNSTTVYPPAFGS